MRKKGIEPIADSTEQGLVGDLTLLNLGFRVSHFATAVALKVPRLRAQGFNLGELGLVSHGGDL